MLSYLSSSTDKTNLQFKNWSLNKWANSFKVATPGSGSVERNTDVWLMWGQAIQWQRSSHPAHWSAQCAPSQDTRHCVPVGEWPRCILLCRFLHRLFRMGFPCPLRYFFFLSEIWENPEGRNHFSLFSSKSASDWLTNKTCLKKRKRGKVKTN